MVLLAMALMAARVAVCSAQTAGPRHAPGEGTVEAQRYVMDVTLDPADGALRANADVTFRCAADLASVELALNPSLQIQAVRDSEGRALEAVRGRQVGSPRFALRLASVCPADSRIELHFDYSGTIRPRPPFRAGNGFFLLRDDDAWYPQAGGFDFAEDDFTVRVPAGFEARTSGRLAERREEGATAVYHWKTAHAVDGRAVVVYKQPLRPPVIVTVGSGTAPRASPSAPELVRVQEICSDAITALPSAAPCGELARRAVPIIERFTAMLGPPPEKTLTIVTGISAVDSAIGYSEPGLLVVSDWAARLATVTDYAPGFLAHEIAHQWFPNGVAPASSSDGWLAESLAEYLAWRYLLEADPEAARVMVAEAMRDAVAYTSLRSLSLGLYLLAGPWSAAHATLYQRGMLVFRTLETAIDRERVDRALVEFYKRYAGRKASIADFRGVCEEIAGRKLGWFFDYFIHGTEIPVIELRRLPSESPGVVAGEIVVRDFPPEGSVRVEMSVRTGQGNVEHSVATHGAVTPFTVNVPAPALGISFDPDLRILRWTEAARRSKAQSAMLAALPDPLTAKDLPTAIEIYRHALAADPDDEAQRAQALHERLGELEWAHNESSAALADLDAAINGHSIGPFETYLCRAEAYLYQGVVQLHEGRPSEARKDAQAGLALPRFVLLQAVPREPIESPGDSTLQQLLESLSGAASRN